jgi:hypothetical protein
MLLFDNKIIEKKKQCDQFLHLYSFAIEDIRKNIYNLEKNLNCKIIP